MVKVRFATAEDAKDISDICSESCRITYAEIYSKEYIEKVIVEFFNIELIKKNAKNHQAIGRDICLGLKVEKLLVA